LENLALRHQIAVLNRLAHKPRLQGKGLHHHQLRETA
jgi:hypothetical protein